MENQSKDIAKACAWRICNMTDIEINSINDQKILISVIYAIIESVRKKQHEATKAYVFEFHEEFNGLDFKLLETIEMPDIEL